ncbi:ATP-binding cassette domain-containing protein [Pseudenhygromyxa sp. WMMC2535]|uniref:ABC transporter ATP-binding protein n=1 Tax=Pseudenhygromyxa sp. WMMC2535 TaxID=2712867 RepID=UPI001554FFF0|nr:ATP-binding cassette domain-containing protein [Pseudenhygromyxa sp. WMMC2535]NVB42119.1 ATP-binding cassette domain-containing protein [Pseudenhygromyxa sp. WMMC2535]
MGQTPAIRLERLGKRFRVNRRDPGLAAALRALFRRDWVEVDAVSELSLAVAAGERVGFLGPNGAGKTTTLKMLAGLLHPSSGRAEVLGHTPARREPAFLRRVALVMGQRRQLSWDLPAVDTFELNRVVFEVERPVYARRLAEMRELLALGDLIHKPVRTLSLGERMKCELVAALLHGPEVLFLDEPTIGMDVAMQAAIREFVRDYGRRHGATVLLTSHYMADVAALCERVVVIDGGRLRFDGSIDALVRRIRPLRRVAVLLEGELDAAARGELGELGEIVEAPGSWGEAADAGGEGARPRGAERLALDVAPARVPEAVARLLALPGARDLAVRDAPLEEVMRELFARHATEGAGEDQQGEDQEGGARRSAS